MFLKQKPRLKPGVLNPKDFDNMASGPRLERGLTESKSVELPITPPRNWPQTVGIRPTLIGLESTVLSLHYAGTWNWRRR